MSPVRTHPLSVPSKADKITKCPVEQKYPWIYRDFISILRLGARLSWRCVELRYVPVLRSWIDSFTGAGKWVTIGYVLNERETGTTYVCKGSRDRLGDRKTLRTAARHLLRRHTWY